MTEPITIETVNRDINDRVNTSLAVSRYIRAVERFESASAEFNEACQKVRATVKPGRFITKIDWKHYLVEVQENGDFEIQEVDFV